MIDDQGPSRDEALWMYERMVISRALEDLLEQAYMEGKAPVFNMARGPIPGEMHLSKGQEPCAVGVCVHLGQDDFVAASHRPHHVAVAKGVNINAMTAEIFGKASGLSGGRGGHMHLFEKEAGFCCSGIVGQSIGLALGHALSAEFQGRGGVSVGFTGEGAANQGIFHEAMNLAALWKLPFICVIEDNRWGVSVSKKRSTAIEKNSDRAVAYGIPGEFVADNDVFGIYTAAARAVARARAGEGPSILELETVRMKGHFLPDTEAYVPKEELSARRDPIEVMRARLTADYGIKDPELEQLHVRANAIASEAVTKARTGPDPRPEDALQYVYA